MFNDNVDDFFLTTTTTTYSNNFRSNQLPRAAKENKILQHL